MTLTLAGAAILPELISDAHAQADMVKELNLPKEAVDVTVKIVWVPSGDPVEGASVFNHSANQLIGKTGGDGTFHTQLPNGTVVRLVEPKYGQQQALRIVQGERDPRKNIRVSSVAEGWTIN